MSSGWSVVPLVALAACSFRGANGLTGDASTGGDGTIADALPPCGERADLLAWWPLDSVPEDLDLVGGKPATASPGVAVTGDGPCGHALTFPAVAAGPSLPHVVIADDARWDAWKRLALWVRVTDAKQAGILSRDSLNTADGSVSLYQDVAIDQVTPLLVVRLQRVGSPNVLLCAPRPAAGTWVHVELDLGPPENQLWIDGVKAVDTTTTISLFGMPCSPPSAIEMTGSPDPFVLGAANDVSTSTTTNALRLPFAGGMISDLRFYTTRR